MLKTDEAMAVAYAPDGRMLATAGCGETIDLRDLLTGARLGRLAGEKSIIRSVAFGLGGKLLAGAGDEGIVRLWDLATGRKNASFPASEARSASSTARAASWRLRSSGRKFAGDGRSSRGEPRRAGGHRRSHGVRSANPAPAMVYFGRGESAFALAFSPGGDILAMPASPCDSSLERGPVSPCGSWRRRGPFSASPSHRTGRTLWPAVDSPAEEAGARRRVHHPLERRQR